MDGHYSQNPGNLLLYSGYLAENIGFNRILPDNVPRVIGETNVSVQRLPASSV